MPGGADLDLFLSIVPGKAGQPPLYFYHVPKTAGTSFRSAVTAALLRDGSSHVVIADVEAALKARGEWPVGFAPLHDRIAALGQMRACLSHDTVLLADHVTAPILSLVREPEAQFWSRVWFDPKLAATLTPRRIVKRFGNQQMKSLSRVAIPLRRPESDVAMLPWLDLVAKVVARMTLFRVSDFALLLDHCHRDYGLTLAEQHKKDGARRRAAAGGTAEPALRALVEEHDPVWLDRILYERVTPGLGSVPRRRA